MTAEVDITIVGAGVIGCAVARELAQAGREIFVIEKNSGITRGENQSSRNSGVIHAGLYYDRSRRPLKAGLCAEGNTLLYRFCEQHGVPFRQTGKLVVAANNEETAVLETYRARAIENGVPVQLVTGVRAAELEPCVRAAAALRLPTSGIINPTVLVHKLHLLAAENGAQFLTSTQVAGIKAHNEGLAVEIEYRDGARDTFLTKLLINAAGLYADEVARLVQPASAYQIDPVRSETMKFYRTKREDLMLQGMNVYPTPRQFITPQGTYFSVGVHLTPTLTIDNKGNSPIGPEVTVGPLSRPAQHKDEYGGAYQPQEVFFNQVRSFFPGLQEGDLMPHQTGIQARLAGYQDWVIEFSDDERRCLNLLGIDSPGLTGSLAIARHVNELVKIQDLA
ncbi:Glycerol-3-phosphate dehydrogenase (EC [Olavius sp. associated proteobacterium Delta 1]|nr:Glycerol-3-phosphate dehydrogenase (EC [Olavius sp. associated proteobacterium Delta 1]